MLFQDKDYYFLVYKFPCLVDCCSAQVSEAGGIKTPPCRSCCTPCCLMLLICFICLTFWVLNNGLTGFTVGRWAHTVVEEIWLSHPDSCVLVYYATVRMKACKTPCAAEHEDQMIQEFNCWLHFQSFLLRLKEQRFTFNWFTLHI